MLNQVTTFENNVRALEKALTEANAHDVELYSNLQEMANFMHNFEESEDSLGPMANHLTVRGSKKAFFYASVLMFSFFPFFFKKLFEALSISLQNCVELCQRGVLLPVQEYALYGDCVRVSALVIACVVSDFFSPLF